MHFCTVKMQVNILVEAEERLKKKISINLRGPILSVLGHVQTLLGLIFGITVSG